MGGIRCCVVHLLFVLFLLTGSHAAFGGKKAPQLAQTIDLPPPFEIDFQFAAKQIPLREIPVYSGRGFWN